MNKRFKVLDLALSYIEKWPSTLETKVIEKDLETRAEDGLERYNTYLSTFNGRDSLIDLYEELLDAYMYAVQYHEESVETGVKHSMDKELIDKVLDALSFVVSDIMKRQTVDGVLRNRVPQPQPSLFEEDLT